MLGKRRGSPFLFSFGSGIPESEKGAYYQGGVSGLFADERVIPSSRLRFSLERRGVKSLFPLRVPSEMGPFARLFLRFPSCGSRLCKPFLEGLVTSVLATFVKDSPYGPVGK